MLFSFALKSSPFFLIPSIIECLVFIWPNRKMSVCVCVRRAGFFFAKLGSIVFDFYVAPLEKCLSQNDPTFETVSHQIGTVLCFTHKPFSLISTIPYSKLLNFTISV